MNKKRNTVGKCDSVDMEDIDGTGTGDRPFRSGPVPVWISDRPVYRSTGQTGRLPFEQPFAV